MNLRAHDTDRRPFQSMVIGTTNAGKVREIAALCRPLGCEIESIELDVPETGSTFADNAMLKARAYSAACPGRIVMVEDSGIEVGKLGGLPGPWSARFHDFDLDTRTPKADGETLPPHEQDRRNNARLLELLEGVPQSDRGASFVIHVIVMKDGELLFRTEGRSYGWISTEARGDGGFGYDPVFIGEHTFGRTYAEMDPRRKNLRSHRKDALREFFLWLSDQVCRSAT